MPIPPTNPFKGRQYPGDVILHAVRWYLQYPLAYEHVAELWRSGAWKWMPAAFDVACKSTRRT